jgi:hypothetical protein
LGCTPNSLLGREAGAVMTSIKRRSEDPLQTILVSAIAPAQLRKLLTSNDRNDAPIAYFDSCN